MYKTIDPLKLKVTPDVILLTDSVGKLIQKDKFFGKKSVFVRKCPTIECVNKLTHSWHTNCKTNSVIIHSGIKQCL